MSNEDKNVLLNEEVKIDNSEVKELKDDSIMSSPVSDNEVPKKTDNSIVLKEKKSSKKIEVPLERKYAWTYKEASAYSGIGVLKLREIVRNNPHADYLMYNGRKTLFKRDKFLEFLDSLYQF